MMRMLHVALVALVAALAPNVHAQKEREVTIGLQAAITSIDPHYHNLSPNNSLLLHIYEPLVYRDANGKHVPGLATSWKALDDLTWESKLRKNVKFHDGTPFTAEDVVATYKRVPNVPNSPSSMATFTRPIVATKIVDPHTIIFKTATAHVLLPSDLGSVDILPKACRGRGAAAARNRAGTRIRLPP